MKFIHTSDWHIGRHFHSVSLLEDQRHVLQQIVEIASAERVDALIIAGDIYDRAVPPAAAIALLDNVFHEISIVHKIPIILISGNHDNAERLGFGAKHMQPSGLHILSRLDDICVPVSITDSKGSITDFYGIPYHTPELVNQVFNQQCKDFNEAHRFLVDRIQANFNKHHKNILLSHSFVRDGASSDSERPLSIGGADNIDAQHLKVFDYVALGHLHKPQKCSAEYIRYSGSIMKYSFSETSHRKAINLVSFEKGQEAEIKQIPLNSLRDVRILEGSFEDIVQEAESDKNTDDYILAKLTDTHVIYDLMGKLRQHYPNILQIEKVAWQKMLAAKPQAKRKAQHQYHEMFTDFYEQVTGEPINVDQQHALAEVMKDIDKTLHAEEGDIAQTSRNALEREK